MRLLNHQPVADMPPLYVFEHHHTPPPFPSQKLPGGEVGSLFPHSFLSWLFNQYIRMLRRQLSSHRRAIVLGIASLCPFTEHEDRRIRNHCTISLTQSLSLSTPAQHSLIRARRRGPNESNRSAQVSIR